MSLITKRRTQEFIRSEKKVSLSRSRSKNKNKKKEKLVSESLEIGNFLLSDQDSNPERK
jgi:hypothetical protein